MIYEEEFHSAWSSMLYVPGNKSKFIEKSHSIGASAVVLDLEDSVPPSEKSVARDSVVEGVKSLASSGSDVLVRINLPLRLAVKDIEAVVVSGVRALVVPKVESAAVLMTLFDLVRELENERCLPVGDLKCIALIESPEGLANIDEIAASPHVIGVALGTEDFCAESGMEPNADTLLVPSQMLVFAARRQGIVPYGYVGSIADYSDLALFENTIERARQLGFEGGFAIHPSQVDVLNVGFMPSDSEIENAVKVINGFNECQQRGEAVFSLNGRMVDRPVVDRACRVLKKANSTLV